MGRRRRIVEQIVAGLSGAAWLVVSVDAHALEVGPPLGRGDRWRIDGEVGVAGDSDAHSTTLGLSPLVRGSYRLAPAWVLSVEWGAAWVRSTPDRGAALTQWAASNLALAAAVEQGSASNPAWWSARAVVALPTARLPSEGPDRGLARSALDFALAARGLFGAWLWAPDQAGAALEGAVIREGTAGPDVPAWARVGAEGGLGLTLPVEDPEGTMQAFGQIAGRALVGGKSFGIGPRVQAVWMPLADSAILQTSVGGELAVWIGEHGLVRIQGMQHFDAPLGDGLGGWGWLVGGSGSW